MDIEGAEYEWLYNISEEELNKISQFVIEFHFIFDPNIFNKLNKFFYLFHFHANNYCGYKIIQDTSIPNVFECTYVNKKFISNHPKLNTKTLPTELDMPNVKECYDYFIDYPPFVNVLD